MVDLRTYDGHFVQMNETQQHHERLSNSLDRNL